MELLFGQAGNGDYSDGKNFADADDSIIPENQVQPPTTKVTAVFCVVAPSDATTCMV